MPPFVLVSATEPKAITVPAEPGFSFEAAELDI